MIQAMIWALVLTSGAGMSWFGTDHELDLGGVAPGQVLQLRLGEEFRIDGDAALGSAVRQADHRAFPGHPHRQGLDFLERHILVIANAALGRSRSGVVLDAVPGKDLDRTVVHLDRKADGHLALADAEDSAHRVLESDDIRGAIELLDGDVEKVASVVVGGPCGRTIDDCNHGDICLLRQLEPAPSRARFRILLTLNSSIKMARTVVRLGATAGVPDRLANQPADGSRLAPPVVLDRGRKRRDASCRQQCESPRDRPAKAAQTGRAASRTDSPTCKLGKQFFGRAARHLAGLDQVDQFAAADRRDRELPRRAATACALQVR